MQETTEGWQVVVVVVEQTLAMEDIIAVVLGCSDIERYGGGSITVEW